MLVCSLSVQARGKFDNTDTITVAKDGSGQFTRINDAIEVCRAFMEYKKVIFVKNGIYKEKVVVPSWLTNIEIVGEDRDKTVITLRRLCQYHLAGDGSAYGHASAHTL